MALLTYITAENSTSYISLDQPLGMSVKMATNGIRTHIRINQRRILEYKSREPGYKIHITHS